MSDSKGVELRQTQNGLEFIQVTVLLLLSLEM